MKRLMAALCTSAAMALTASAAFAVSPAPGAPAPGAPAAAAAAPAKAAKVAKAPALPPLYAGLDLSDAQKARLSEKLEAKKAALAEWDAKHGAHQAELKKTADEAKKAKNAEQAKTANAELDGLKKERAALEAKQQAEIDAIFTPEQKKALEVQNIYNGMMNSFRKANLTEKQKVDAKALIAKTVAESNAKDAAPKPDLTKKIHALIEADILTAEQRAALTNKPEAKPAPAVQKL